jgi:hypothetical protein
LLLGGLNSPQPGIVKNAPYNYPQFSCFENLKKETRQAKNYIFALF